MRCSGVHGCGRCDDEGDVPRALMLVEVMNSIMQTRTRAGLGFLAIVKDYRLTYYMSTCKVGSRSYLADVKRPPPVVVPR